MSLLEREVKVKGSFDSLKISRDRQKAKKVIAAIFGTLLLLYICYYVLFPLPRISVCSFIIFFLSVCLVEWGVLDILKRGILVSNIFSIAYFCFLAINCFGISELQQEKKVESIYYLVIGAVIFIICVRAFEKCKIVRIKRKHIFNLNIIAMVFFAAFVVLKIIIFSKTGIRIFDANYAKGEGTKYVVGGLSGLSEMMMWISLMFVPVIEKKYKAVICTTAFILYGLFALSRNNMMLISVFVVICIIQSKGRQFLIDKKIIRRVALFGVILLMAFTVFGNYRQRQRGWNDPSKTIQNLLESKVDNSIVNWTYSYTSINYDVILQCMANREHPYTLYSIFSPLTRLVGDYDGLADYQDEVFHIHGLNGYNASTIWGPMIYELGELYILGVLLLGIIVGLWIIIAKIENSKGFLAYLMTWAAMSVFGNFYTITVYFYISIAASLVFAVFGKERIVN